MRSGKVLAALFLVAMLMNPASVSAIPVPALDLPELTAASDLIVVGQVLAIREEGRTTINTQGGPVQARQMVATLRAFRVLKGQAGAPSVSFGFLIPEVDLAYGGVAEKQVGMFFLKEVSKQKYEVLNPYYPSIVAAPDAPATEGAALDRVVAEVAYVLNSAKSSPDERERAVSILETVETPAATEALKKAARTPGGPPSLRAVAALLRRNDASVLDLAERALTVAPQGAEAGVRLTLALAIRDGVTTPDAVPALARLLRARDVETRRGAAAALRHVGTDSVVAPLSDALQDNDREVRYQAVLGLAAVTGQSDWGPSIDLFTQDEQRYLEYWKDWAKGR
jgi:hypothetical protein